MNTPITHAGTQCTECTAGASIHANNAHLVTPKSHTAYRQCQAGCTHPIAIQPQGQALRSVQATWEAGQMRRDHGYQSNGVGSCRECGLPYSAVVHQVHA